MICHERCRGLQTSASDMTELTLFTPSCSLDWLRLVVLTKSLPSRPAMRGVIRAAKQSKQR